MGEIQEDKEKVAELCGAVIGDGWIQSNERGFFLAGDPNEDREYYDNYIANLVSQILFKVKPRHFPYWSVYGISLYKRDSIKKLLEWGLPKGKKVDSAEIPKWIINSNKSIIYSFIRGLFDTDGNISCQKDYTKYADEFNSTYHTKARLRFTTISKKLADQIFELLKKLHFRTVKRILKRGHIQNNRKNNDVYIIEINELKSIHQFFGNLWPSNPKHITKYQVWKKFGFCPPYTTIKQRKDILKNKLNPYNLYTQE